MTKYWQNKKRSKETKDKISQSLKGHVISKETRRKISNTCKGRELSEECKKKISISDKEYYKTHKGPWAGKKFSKETRQEMSLAKKGQIPWHKGKKLPKEIRNKMSKSHLGFKHTKETREKCRRITVKRLSSEKGKHRDTGIECKVKQQLRDANVKFIFQFSIDNRFVCDFYLPEKNLIIEADGDYWHNRPETMRKDIYKNIYLSNAGYNVLHIWESIINDKMFNVMNYI